MTAYVIRMLILLPLVAGMAVGALWLWRRVGPNLTVPRRDRQLTVVDALPMGTAGKLALVEFGDRQLLIAVTRTRIDLLAEAPRSGASRLSEGRADD